MVLYKVVAMNKLIVIIGAVIVSGCPLKKEPSNLVYQLDKEVIALKQQVAYLESKSNCGDNTPSEIYSELVQIIPESQAVVRRDGSAAEIEILVGTIFPSGSLRIRKEVGMTLDLMATALNLHPKDKIIVIGYSDNTPVGRGTRGCYASNWELSAVRAAAVARALIDEYQVDPRRVTVSARGAMEPVADNDTPSGRASNRRIVIRVEQGD